MMPCGATERSDRDSGLRQPRRMSGILAEDDTPVLLADEEEEERGGAAPSSKAAAAAAVPSSRAAAVANSLDCCCCCCEYSLCVCVSGGAAAIPVRTHLPLRDEADGTALAALLRPHWTPSESSARPMALAVALALLLTVLGRVALLPMATLELELRPPQRNRSAEDDRLTESDACSRIVAASAGAAPRVPGRPRRVDAEAAAPPICSMYVLAEGARRVTGAWGRKNSVGNALERRPTDGGAPSSAESASVPNAREACGGCCIGMSPTLQSSAPPLPDTCTRWTRHWSSRVANPAEATAAITAGMDSIHSVAVGPGGAEEEPLPPPSP